MSTTSFCLCDPRTKPSRKPGCSPQAARRYPVRHRAMPSLLPPAPGGGCPLGCRRRAQPRGALRAQPERQALTVSVLCAPSSVLYHTYPCSELGRSKWLNQVYACKLLLPPQPSTKARETENTESCSSHPLHGEALPPPQSFPWTPQPYRQAPN